MGSERSRRIELRGPDGTWQMTGMVRVFDPPRVHGTQHPRADDGCRGAVALADARHPLQADLAAERRSEAFDQRLASRHRTGERVADAHRQFGHRRIVVGKGEVVVEARDLVDLGLRESQPLGERPQVARSQRMELVVEAVQVLEQAVAT